MKYLLLFCLLAALAPPLTAQQMVRSVVATAGTTFQTTNVGSLHFTLGEIATERTDNGLVLDAGFQRGVAQQLSTSVWSAPEIQLDLQVFPNPTVDLVRLSGDWQAGDRLLLSDFLGRRVIERALRPGTDEMDLRAQPAGPYLLTLTRAGQPLRNLRIVRQ